MTNKNDDAKNRRDINRSPLRKENRRDLNDTKLKNRDEKSLQKEHKQGDRLFVENLDLPNRELEKLFSKFGPILETWSVRSIPRYAFILFKHKDDAIEALEAMNGFDLQGKKLKVSYAQEKTYKDMKRDNQRERNHQPSKKTSDSYNRSRKDSMNEGKEDDSHRNSRFDRRMNTHSERYSNTQSERQFNKQISYNTLPDSRPYMRPNSQRCYQCGKVGHLMRQCWSSRRDAFRERGRRPNRVPQTARVSNMLDDLTDVYADAKRF